MSRRPRRDLATTMFALILWAVAVWFGWVALGGFRFGERWPLLLWFVPALVLVRIGWDLWEMGKAK